jgi:hypothetical protein
VDVGDTPRVLHVMSTCKTKIGDLDNSFVVHQNVGNLESVCVSLGTWYVKRIKKVVSTLMPCSTPSCHDAALFERGCSGFRRESSGGCRRRATVKPQRSPRDDARVQVGGKSKENEQCQHDSHLFRDAHDFRCSELDPPIEQAAEVVFHKLKHKEDAAHLAVVVVGWVVRECEWVCGEECKLWTPAARTAIRQHGIQCHD